MAIMGQINGKYPDDPRLAEVFANTHQALGNLGVIECSEEGPEHPSVARRRLRNRQNNSEDKNRRKTRCNQQRREELAAARAWIDQTEA